MFAPLFVASIDVYVPKPAAPPVPGKPWSTVILVPSVVPLNECLWVGSEMVVVDVLVLEAVAVFG